MNPSRYSKLPFNAEKDFATVLMFVSIANLLVVHPSIPARSVKELIALVKTRPNQLTIGSAGVGTSSHLSGEPMKMMGGVKLTHVPYKGLAPAHVDTIGGQLSMMFDGIVTGVPAAKAGRLRAGRHYRKALARRAGHSGDCGGVAGLRGQLMVRPARTHGHAARDHHAVKHRSRQRTARARAGAVQRRI